MKFEKIQNRQKYHHSLKEHPMFSKMQSSAVKCCKMQKIQPCEVGKFCIYLYYGQKSDNQLILLIIIFLRVIQMYTKFAKFARLYFLQFTTFHNQTSQF